MRHRPLVWIVTLFTLGIFLQQWLVIETFWVGLLIIVGLVVVSLVYTSWISTIILFVMFLATGYFYSLSCDALHKNDITHIAKYYSKKPIVVEGVVDSAVQRRGSYFGQKTSFNLTLRQVKAPWGWESRKGKILVNAFSPTEVKYGDVVQAKGKLHYPFEFDEDSNFSYRKYLKVRGVNMILSVKKDQKIEIVRRGEGSVWRAKALKIRGVLKKSLEAHLTKNESGIMKAILIGDRVDIPKHVRELFVRTGTVHILAISGLHVGIIAGLILVMLRLLPIARGAQFALAALLLFGYIFLTGMRPSVIRATIMAIVLLVGLLIERETDSINNLSIAALIILLINPMNLFDVGFQLSFICVLSILLGAPKIKQGICCIWPRAKCGILAKFVGSLSVSIAVWIGVVGVIAYYFQIITPVTIIANLVVVPLTAVVVTLGVGLLLVSLSLPPLAIYFATCLKISLNIMVGAIYIFEKIPGAWFIIS